MSTPSTDKIVYINGAYVRESAVQIGLSNRSFRFGDNLFETIKVGASGPAYLDYHLQRLDLGAKSVKIVTAVPDVGEVQEICNELARLNNLKFPFILRVMVTRGSGGQGYLPDSNSQPDVYIYASEYTESKNSPLRLLISDYRKIPSACLPVACKLGNAQNMTLARLESSTFGYDEALMLSIGNHISECSSANIFWITNGQIHTPSLDADCLAGVTRRVLLEKSPNSITQGLYSLQELYQASQIFVTNSVSGIRLVDGIYQKNHLRVWQSQPNDECSKIVSDLGQLL